MKQAHFIGASMIALIASSPAFAQTQTQTTAPAIQSPEPDNNNPDIIVTASKRSQTLQDTPISVSVTTAQSIEQSQVRDLIDLQSLVPSLKVGQLQSSANTNFIIRGFGNGANNAGIEPSVGVFIDNVYRSRSAAQIADLPQIERVEVLRGPQSTLFGKNASAGIISIVTAQPSHTFGGVLEASYGNYNAIVLKAAITGPLSETLAFSVSGNYNKRDGYGRDLQLGIKTADRNRYGGRAQLLFEPSADFKVRIIGDYDKIDENCCIVTNFFDGPSGNAIRALGGRINSNNPYSYDTYNNQPSVNRFDNYGVSAQIDANITDNLALTSISAYRAVRGYTNQDSDFTGADAIGNNYAHTKINTYTQEFRLTSNFDGPLNFLLGAFYFRESIGIDASLTFGKDFRNYAGFLSGGAYNSASLEATLRSVNPGLPAGQFGAQGQGRFENYAYDDDAISGFGQVDFKITDKLTATGGFNYTIDRKTVATNTRSTDIFSSIDLDASVATLRQGGIAQTISPFFGGAPGSFATAAQIQTFATANPAGYAAIVAGVSAQVNPLLGLKPLQFIPPFLNIPNAVESGKTRDSNFSYTLRLAYKFDRHLNAYASYATGFKASSFNLSVDSRPFARDFIPGSPVNNPAASPIRTAGLALNNLTSGTRYAGPEDAEVYEVGVKGNWQGFGFNLAVFKQTIKGFQQNTFVGTGFVLINAGKESVKGFELDASLSPTRRLNFTASLTYLDPVFDSFVFGQAFNPATNTTVQTDLSGRKPSGISDYSIAIGSTYSLPLADKTNLIFHGDFALDSAFTIAQGLPYKAAPESLNASVTLQLANGLEVTAWGRNLTEPKYNIVIFPSVAQAGSLSAYPSPPRTYGGSLRFKF